MVKDKKKKSKGLFITGTDTDVGKTVATLVLGHLFKGRGYDVGVMKPVQCAGHDARLLKESLSIQDSLDEINPYQAKSPLSPHIAFARDKKSININKILKGYQILKDRHDIVLVEGAGGLMVPLKNNYLIIDLIKELDLDVIIVARPGLGTINHTLLTINQIREYGLNVKGVIFSETSTHRGGVAEQTNPDAIKRYGRVNILGTIPYLKTMTGKNIIKQCRSRIRIHSLIKTPPAVPAECYADWDGRYLWHPFTQMKDWLKEEAVVIDRARGSYLIDTKGQRYLDGVSSLWLNVHGHGHPSIDRGIKNQINRLSHSTLLGLSNTPAVELAKKLVEITPKGLEKVFYSDNGSTSVEIGIKMAYQYWQNIGRTKKVKIAHLSNSYHGDTLGSVSVGGIDLFHKVYRKLIFKTIKVDFPDCYRAPCGKQYPEYAFECLDRFEEMLKQQSDSVAALVVEPLVQGAAGMIMWPKGILKRMAQLCRQYDVIFIVDEVATGFGRTGTMFACEHEQVEPDILCLSKGLTGGYLPLAATLTSQKIYDGFLFDYKDMKTFFHGHTYTGNPLGCAAALNNLAVFQQEKTLSRLLLKIKYLDKQLKLFYTLSSVGDVRQKGFMVGIELVEDQVTKKPFDWSRKIGVRVCQKARARGVMLRPLGHVIVLMPPLSMSIKELKTLLDVTYWAIKSVTREILLLHSIDS